MEKYSGDKLVEISSGKVLFHIISGAQDIPVYEYHCMVSEHGKGSFQN